jgi:hypothetical protein
MTRAGWIVTNPPGPRCIRRTLVKKPVAHLTDEDILAMSAYLASLTP